MAEARLPYVTVGGTTIPSTNIVVPLEVTVGRQDPSQQPDANALTFGYRGDTFPSYIHRGAPVVVWFAAPSGNPDVWEDIWDDVWKGDAAEQQGSIRFLGRVADISAQPDPVNGKVVATVTCIGTLTDLADQIIGDEPWPVETDRERVARIIPLLRGDLLLVNQGSTALRLRRRDADRRKILELLHLFAGSVGSIVWENPDGSIRYDAFDLRDVPDSYVHLPPQAITSDANWGQSTDQLIDRVRVEYGDDPEEGNRPEFVAGNGVHETRLSAEAADLPTAQVVADTVLSRWGRVDIWDAPQVITRSDLLDEATYGALLAVLPGDPLSTGGLTQLPSPGTASGGLWFIEGWQERWDREGNNAPLVHHFTLAVTDVRRFAVNGDEVPLVLTVDPTSWAVGPNVLTASVSTPDGSYLPNVGTMSLSVDGFEPAYPVNLSDYSAGTLTWTLYLNQFPPGKHTFQAIYSGAPGQYRPSSSNAVDTTVSVSDYSQITLTSATSLPHVGDSHTLVADLFDETGAVPEGTVEFEYGPTIDGPWTVGGIVDAPGGDDGSRVTFAWNVPATLEVFWRAHYRPSDTGTVWVDSLSNILGITPVRRVERLLTYDATGSATYDDTGTQLAVPDVRQGDHGDGTGDNRGLITFGVAPADWARHYITKVEVFLHLIATAPGSESATVRIGSYHGTTGLPAAGVDADYLHRLDVPDWPLGTGKWVDITGWGKHLPLGLIPSLIVGPADGADAAVGIVEGFGTGVQPPLLRVTGYEWTAAIAGSWDTLSGTWDDIDPTTTWDDWE